MTPFEVTVLSVTLNAAGIVPSANNRFPPPNVIGNIFSQNASTKSCLRSLAHLDRRPTGDGSLAPPHQRLVQISGFQHSKTA
jgi:hypothetical protein